MRYARETCSAGGALKHATRRTWRKCLTDRAEIDTGGKNGNDAGVLGWHSGHTWAQMVEMLTRNGREIGASGKLERLTIALYDKAVLTW